MLDAAKLKQALDAYTPQVRTAMHSENFNTIYAAASSHFKALTKDVVDRSPPTNAEGDSSDG